MKKAEMVEIITSSPAWDGCSAEALMKYTVDEVKDIYDQLDIAEEEYFSNCYENDNE